MHFQFRHVLLTLRLRLAVLPLVVVRALALVPVELVHAGAAVQARVGIALVHVALAHVALNAKMLPFVIKCNCFKYLCILGRSCT